MYFMNIIIHQLMCKPRARLYILHLGPVLLTHVLILVNTRPTRKIVIESISSKLQINFVCTAVELAEIGQNLKKSKGTVRNQTKTSEINCKRPKSTPSV